MQPLAQWLIENIVLAILVLTRLSLLLTAIPAIGAGVPKRVLVFLAVTMTALLLPSIADTHDPATLPQFDHLAELAIAVAREGMIGLLIGSTIQLIITGLQLGGEMITSTGGMQLGDAIDPSTRASMPALAKFVGLLVSSVMLAVGGHRILLGVLLDSFTALPPGQVVFHDSMMELVIVQLTAGLVAGVRVAAPVVGALLLSNLITGLVSRTLPQINVLAIGLSINALALLVVSALTLGSAGLVFQDELANAATALGDLW